MKNAGFVYIDVKSFIPGYMMELRDLLSLSGLSDGLNENHVSKLVDAAELLSFDRGEVIISEANRARDLFIVHSGVVSVVMAFPTDTEKSETVDRLHAGKVLGEIAFIDGSPRSATVIAEERAKLYVLPYEVVNKLLESDHEFGYHFMRSLARILTAKVRQTNLAWRNLMMW